MAASSNSPKSIDVATIDRLIDEAEIFGVGFARLGKGVRLAFVAAPDEAGRAFAKRWRSVVSKMRLGDVYDRILQRREAPASEDARRCIAAAPGAGVAFTVVNDLLETRYSGIGFDAGKRSDFVTAWGERLREASFAQAIGRELSASMR